MALAEKELAVEGRMGVVAWELESFVVVGTCWAVERPVVEWQSNHLGSCFQTTLAEISFFASPFPSRHASLSKQLSCSLMTAYFPHCPS